MARTSHNPAAVCNLPDHATMVANIASRYIGAEKHHVHAGYGWYGEAQQFARSLAAGSAFPLRSVAGIIAALSPQCGWQKNKEDAIAAIDVFNIAGRIDISLHTKVQMGKVRAILEDGVVPLEVLKGPKESAFFRNIMGDYSVCTVDRWAFKAATGRALPDVNPLTGKALGGIGRGAYKRIHAAYVDAAAFLGIPVAILQAIVWIVERGSAI